MSSSNIAVKQPTAKSLTGSFELQTKIRVIIQEVLAATIRKLSHFGDKIQKFEQYFITFKQRFQTAERQRNKQQQQMQKIQQSQIIIRRDLNFHDIRYNQDKQRSSIANKQRRDQFSQVQKQVKTLLRQNQNINSQLSKTKSKFLEYSNIISTLKQQVSWKITKYLQQTAQSHTQMKVYSQRIKMVEKQKQKYDEIIIKYEQDNSFKNDITNKITQISNDLNLRKQQINKISTKVDDVQFSFLSKIKLADSKFDSKMNELQKNNSKLTNVFKKIDTFNNILETLKQQIEEIHTSQQKKLDDNLKKSQQFINNEILKLNKQNVKLEKAFDKKLMTIDQKIEKQQDFFIQKLDFIKMQIESDMTSKTSKILEQKSKAQQHLNNSTIDEINGKINKMQLQNSKSINKVEANLKQSIVQIKIKIDKIKEDVQDRMDNIGTGPHRGGSDGVSSQKIHMINNEINHLKQQIKGINNKTEILWNGKQQLDKIVEDLKKKLDIGFLQLDQKLNTKVQRVMFLVTKMRGDSIIRNQFNDKQIKQLKKTHLEVKQRLQGAWKLIPGIGQCVFLILSLIYDAEFQHSRIIQDSLPVLSKDVQKFNTCSEGVIYEFKQKKKPGSIFYRHAQIKKTDIVKATFNAYIQVWQQVYEGELKSKQNFLPKNFYKKLVQKFLKPPFKASNEKQFSPGNTTSFNQLINQKSASIANQNRNNSQTNIDMNSSFHIRKKKTISIKQKQKEKQQLPLNENIEKIDE